MLGKPTPFKSRQNRHNIQIPINVKKAKEFPIENIYTGELVKTNKVKMGICPFHFEDTPSFAVYPASNTWYCFACGVGGDVIKFYQELHGCDFGSAVEELSK